MQRELHCERNRATCPSCNERYRRMAADSVTAREYLLRALMLEDRVAASIPPLSQTAAKVQSYDRLAICLRRTG
ncbi:MAG: hypothetical protein ACT4QE_13080 [Anaerolineales bacterium]